MKARTVRATTAMANAQNRLSFAQLSLTPAERKVHAAASAPAARFESSWAVSRHRCGFSSGRSRRKCHTSSSLSTARCWPACAAPPSRSIAPSTPFHNGHGGALRAFAGIEDAVGPSDLSWPCTLHADPECHMAPVAWQNYVTTFAKSTPLPEPLAVLCAGYAGVQKAPSASHTARLATWYERGV